MSQCNFCKLLSIKRMAKKQGLKVTVLPDARWGMGGVNVYAHPREVIIKDLPDGEDGHRSVYREAWFMELPDSCQC